MHRQREARRVCSDRASIGLMIAIRRLFQTDRAGATESAACEEISPRREWERLEGIGVGANDTTCDGPLTTHSPSVSWWCVDQVADHSVPQHDAGAERTTSRDPLRSGPASLNELKHAPE
jgi:hypothetical protein